MSEVNLPLSPLAPEASPLGEADPNSINELLSDRIDRIFNTNALDLTDADLRTVIEYYRKERLRFLVESQAKIAAGPRSKKAAPKSVAEALEATVDLI